jgi:paraquat-inducible protein A
LTRAVHGPRPAGSLWLSGFVPDKTVESRCSHHIPKKARDISGPFSYSGKVISQIPMNMIASIFMAQMISIAEKFPRTVKAVQVLLVITLVLFIMGISMPILTISRLWILTDEVSVLSGLWQLLDDQQYFIFFIIFLFSILLPIMKLYYLFMLSFANKVQNKNYRKYLHLMHRYGRWSMLDVFVVAVLIVTVKLGALADIIIEPGMYFFTAAVVLLMIITSVMVILESKLDLD